MRILIYAINYAPELTGIGKYVGEMATWLAKRGYRVTVVTAMPYYPDWRIQDAYRGRLWHTEQRGGVRVYRCPLYVPKEVTPTGRILHEISFIFGIFPVWLLTLFQKKHDFVFCVSPPFHLGLLPLAYVRLRGSVLVSHIQDLQVDAARELGMIQNKAVLRMMYSTERFILRHSTMVSTISEGMAAKIESKGVPASRIFLFPNWVDLSAIYPLPKKRSLRAELNIGPEKQVVLYAGNMGEKQGLEMMVEVAYSFVSRPEVLFVIVGSGGERKKLEEMVRMAQLPNVMFLPTQPIEKFSALLAIADVHLVLQKSSAADLVMPSKLAGILAAGGVVVVTAQPSTSLHELVANRSLGIVVDPESVPALRQGIELGLAADREALGKRARAYAEKHLGRETILQAFEQDMLRIIRDNHAVEKK